MEGDEAIFSTDESSINNDDDLNDNAKVSNSLLAKDENTSQVGEFIFICKNCRAILHHPNHCIEHIQFHKNEEQFLCECGSRFNKRTALLQHQRRKHNIRRKNSTGLKSKNLNPGKYPFKCGICEERFKTYEYATRHSSIHPEYRNVKCTKCVAAFEWDVELIVHSAQMHVDGKEIFECVVCSRSFDSKVKLEIHQRHSNHKFELLRQKTHMQ